MDKTSNINGLIEEICKKLGDITFVDFERELIMKWESDPSEIKNFEKYYGKPFYKED